MYRDGRAANGTNRREMHSDDGLMNFHRLIDQRLYDTAAARRFFGVNVSLLREPDRKHRIKL